MRQPLWEGGRPHRGAGEDRTGGVRANPSTLSGTRRERQIGSDRRSYPRSDGDLVMSAAKEPGSRGSDTGRRYHGGMPSKVLLAAPRGYCAGVERAVDAVQRALAKHGSPVYVRKQIVHNAHVVRDLESKGAVFVEEETEVPHGAVVVLSAHGVAPEVYTNSGARDLTVIDATCPLVTKVHLEARRFAGEGQWIVLIGHAGHEEVVGTTGQAPERTILVQSPDEARVVELPDPDHASYLTQTTLSVDETN